MPTPVIYSELLAGQPERVNCAERSDMSKRYWHTKSSRSDKLTWLLNHQHLWEGWQDLGDPRKKKIVEIMKREGLVSDKTNWSDINLTSLIVEARNIRRGSK